MESFMQQMTDTYLPDVLHAIAQGLLIPTMVALLLLLVVTLFFLGQVVFEFFTERRAYKQNMPQIVNDINDAGYADIERVVRDSKLLRFQKAALLTCTRNMGLEDDALFSLAQIEIGKAEKHYKFRLAWTDTISKIGPLLGLMGTLIPLGPGMVALGKNDVSALSSSLLLAFDATVCGLVCATVSLIISKIRSGWYTSYIGTLESIMSVIMERAAQARSLGIALPKGYEGDVMKEFREAPKGAAGAGISPKTGPAKAVPAKIEPVKVEPVKADMPKAGQAATAPVEAGPAVAEKARGGE